MPFITLPGIGDVHINTRGCKRPKCAFCPSESAFLCDFPIGEHATCDKRICYSCREIIGAGKDHCPEHSGAEARLAA